MTAAARATALQRMTATHRDSHQHFNRIFNICIFAI